MFGKNNFCYHMDERINMTESVKSIKLNHGLYLCCG